MEPVVWTVEGNAVYGQYHAPPSRSKEAVLCLHGLNSSVGEFGAFPARLATAGFHVLAFDQRGFGASGGERGRIGLDRALVDVEGAIAVLRSKVGKGMRLGVIGHSLGGAYALGIQARQGLFEALAIAHVPERILDEAGRVERAAMHGIGRWNRRRMRKGRGSLFMPYRVSYRHLFQDPVALQVARAEPFMQDRVNLANYEFANTMSSSSWAARVTAPTLCIQSDKDRVVDPAHSFGVYDALAGPTRIVAHDGGHSCFRDRGGDDILDACAHWFHEHLGGRR